MHKGFGLQRTYKLVISSAIGGVTELAIPASSNRSARWQTSAILNVLANPSAIAYQDKAKSLGLGHSLDALKDLGEQMAANALVVEAHPEFVAKIAQRVALTKEGLSSVVVADRLNEMIHQVKPNHFVATLYSPNGKGLLQYSNLIELNKYEDWEDVK